MKFYNLTKEESKALAVGLSALVIGWLIGLSDYEPYFVLVLVLLFFIFFVYKYKKTK